MLLLLLSKGYGGWRNFAQGSATMVSLCEGSMELERLRRRLVERHLTDGKEKFVV
jgi:hypothetical protein